MTTTTKARATKKTDAKGGDPIEFVIKELESLLTGGNAHADFDQAVKGVSHALLGKVPEGSAYSIWQLTEHIRIAQWDILEFSKNQDHVSPPWPEGYWPKDPEPPDAHAWKKSVDRIREDRDEFIALLKKAGSGIYSTFSHGDGQSLFREALVIADHTAYHTGEIILLRRILKDWH